MPQEALHCAARFGAMCIHKLAQGDSSAVVLCTAHMYASPLPLEVSHEIRSARQLQQATSALGVRPWSSTTRKMGSKPRRCPGVGHQTEEYREQVLAPPSPRQEDLLKVFWWQCQSVRLAAGKRRNSGTMHNSGMHWYISTYQAVWVLHLVPWW